LLLDEERTTALFRICQEALTNVTRYAEASEVHIVLEAGREQITLRIQDNGRGITAVESRKTSSFGLLGMRERARLLGGTFDVSGAPGQGTTLTVCLPSPQPAPMESPA
jgi:signal transduction histidine kinase